MCRMASFLHKCDETGLDLCVVDPKSHSNTQKACPEKTEATGWYEGHYTPDGKIECRTPDGRDAEAERMLRERYPTFWDFMATFPANLKTLYLNGATLPVGVKFPANLKTLYLYDATLPVGVKFPANLEALYLYDATLPVGVEFPKGCKVYR